SAVGCPWCDDDPDQFRLAARWRSPARERRKTMVSAARETWSDTEIESFYASGHWRHEAPATLVASWAAAEPDRTFLYEGGLALTRREVLGRSLRVAAGLRHLGVVAGDRVAVQLPNWHEFVIAQFALWQLGAILVPIMPVYRDHEVKHVLEATEAVALIYTPAFRGFDYRAMAMRLAETVATLDLLIVVRPEDGVHGAEVAFGELGTGSDGSTTGSAGPGDGR